MGKIIRKIVLYLRMYEKMFIFASNFYTMKHDQWHLQELGTPWKGAGLYHVTLTIPSREPLLGTLVIPDNDPSQAKIERSEFGEAIVHTIFQIQDFYPEVKVLQFCLMPDHAHVILYVTREMSKGIRTVVRGWWQGTKKAYMERIPNDIRNKERSEEGSEGGSEGRIAQVFTEKPHIQAMGHSSQLPATIRYIQMNPERLATKLLKPGFFRVQDNIEIAGRIYSGVGNSKLLQAMHYASVHVRSTMVDEAAHGDDKRLRDYMNGCVLSARQGAIMVSPFISEYEKAVMKVLLEERLPFIYLADNGFRDYYKPQDGLFDAVAEGKVLILSPWPYDAKKKRVSRAECVAMNKMAEDICLFFCPE